MLYDMSMHKHYKTIAIVSLILGLIVTYGNVAFGEQTLFIWSGNLSVFLLFIVAPVFAALAYRAPRSRTHAYTPQTVVPSSADISTLSPVVLEQPADIDPLAPLYTAEQLRRKALIVKLLSIAKKVMLVGVGLIFVSGLLPSLSFYIGIVALAAFVTATIIAVIARVLDISLPPAPGSGIGTVIFITGLTLIIVGTAVGLVTWANSGNHQGWEGLGEALLAYLFIIVGAIAVVFAKYR